jgi:hypothetical protein
MWRLKTTWPRFRKAVFFVIFINFCLFLGLLFIVDNCIVFYGGNRLEKYLHYTQYVALIVSFSVARWILFIKKDEDGIADDRENEAKKTSSSDAYSNISEMNFFSMFAMLFCFLAIFYVVDYTSLFVEIIYRNGREAFGKLRNFSSFEFPHAFSLFIVISAFIFIKNLFLKRRVAFFVDIFIIGTSIFVILYYSNYLDMVYIYTIRSVKSGW